MSDSRLGYDNDEGIWFDRTKPAGEDHRGPVFEECDPEEVCGELERRLSAAERERDEMRDMKDGAYSERNKLVAALSKVFPACLQRHPEYDTEWEDDWRWIVFIDARTGQMSWHIHDTELAQFDHLNVYGPDHTDPAIEWDGHTVEEKYQRLAAIDAAREGGEGE